MQFDDAEGLFESVLKEGGGEVWYPALKYFVSLPDKTTSDAHIARALKHMETDDHVQPQHVLEILSQSPTLTLAAIRRFFVAHVVGVEKKATADRRTARRLADDAARLTESISRTRTAPLVRRRAPRDWAHACDCPPGRGVGREHVMCMCMCTSGGKRGGIGSWTVD